MPQYLKIRIVAVLGILIFLAGAGIRLNSDRLSRSVNTDPFGKEVVSDIDQTQRESITYISSVLLWSGGALFVLSLGVWVSGKSAE